MVAPLLRFAPSPTGPLHLGGLRTALYNHLYAKKFNGKWILRVEDTDMTRFVPGAVDDIRKSMEWAGLEYDFGPGRNGPHGPYFQSERLDLYHHYSKKLLDSGHAYRCFCSADKLSTTRERLARTGSNETYDKACLQLTEEEVARKVKAGEKHVIRLNNENVPKRSEPSDIVFGALKDAHLSLPTDPILLKTDRYPTYHLASVVDDHEMGITHVLRGEEWLTSLPLHLDLYACLSLRPPQYAHLPILLNPDGTKMSKRKGDVQVLDYIRHGWEPSAVLNWLALAGWGVKYESPPETASEPTPSSSSHKIVQKAPDSTTLLTLPELIDQFDLTALTHRRNVLDVQKLAHLNKRHLMNVWATDDGLKGLAERVRPNILASFPNAPSERTSVDYIKKVIRTLEARLTNLQDVPVHGTFFFASPDWSTDEAHEMMGKFTEDERNETCLAVSNALNSVEDEAWEQTDFGKMLREKCSDSGVTPKAFMTVVRHALTGMKDGPPVGDIIRTLGRKGAADRIDLARDLTW